MPNRALRLCKALCDRQRGRSFYPEVIVGLDQLAEELGVQRKHVIRDNKRLIAAGLLSIISGGGRLPASRTGRANVYQLGARIAGDIEAILTVPKPGQLTVPKRGRYPRSSRSPYSPYPGTPTPSEQSSSGGSGEMTVALTGDPTTDQPLPAAVSSHRLRDLAARVFSPGKKG